MYLPAAQAHGNITSWSIELRLKIDYKQKLESSLYFAHSYVTTYLSCTTLKVCSLWQWVIQFYFVGFYCETTDN